MEELYQNSHISMNQLAEKLPMARQTITKIKQELWQDRTIYAPTIILNPNRIKLYYYFIELAGNPTDSEILRVFLPIPEIKSIDLILGDYSILLQVVVHSKTRFLEILNIIDNTISQNLFSHYNIFQAIQFYKIGGFKLPKSKEIIPITPSQWKILQLLHRNSNINLWEIRNSDNSIFSKSDLNYLKTLNIRNECRFFENTGIIQAFSLSFSRPTPDFQFKFFLRIKPKKNSDYPLIAQKLTLNPFIVDLFRVNEDSAIFAIFRVSNLQRLKEFIYSLYNLYGVDKTFTTLVMQEIIPGIYPPTLDVAKFLSK